jgi:DNA invertase Pin-like site-specific DNA recombinase
MQNPRYVTYLRVSTVQQARSGLGLAAQRAAVESFVTHQGGSLVGEFTEVESGRRDDRPELAKALKQVRLTGARLLVAKMDRLSRSVAFLAALQESGVPFVAADLPSMNELAVGLMALLAREERRLISARTTAALAVARTRLSAQGKRLGNPYGAEALRRAAKGNSAAVAAIREAADRRARELREVIADVEASGLRGNRRIANELNRRGILSLRSGQWSDTTVARLRHRQAAIA